MPINSKLLFYPREIHERIIRDDRNRNNHRIVSKKKPIKVVDDSPDKSLADIIIDKLTEVIKSDVAAEYRFSELGIDSDSKLWLLGPCLTSIKFKSNLRFVIWTQEKWNEFVKTLNGSTPIPIHYLCPKEEKDLDAMISVWNNGLLGFGYLIVNNGGYLMLKGH